MNIFLHPVQEKIQVYQQLPPALQKPIVGGRLSKGYQSFLIACMPKSGSTWLCNIISELPDFRITHLVPYYGGREQEICGDTIDKNLQASCSFQTISQHHVKYNINTRSCCILYCIKPIILLRNIRDNLVSVVDHWKNEDISPGFSSYLEREYFDPQFQMSTQGHISPLEYAVILHAPWILNFYLSWKKFQVNPAGGLPSSLQPLFVSYEQLVDNTFDSVSALVREIGFDASDDEIHLAISKTRSKNTRLNKGISGRGAQAFSNDQAASDALSRLISLYAHEDLSGIGV